MGKEKTAKAGASAPKMISVDEANAQMKTLMGQANQRIQQLAIQLQNYESMLKDKTIENLFKVLEYSHNFKEEFVEKCAGVIEQYLTKVAIETPAEQQPAGAAAPENAAKKEAEAETKED